MNDLEEDELELEVEGEEDEGVESSLYPSEEEEKPAVQEKPPVLDAALLGKTIADNLGGVTAQQSKALEGTLSTIAGLLQSQHGGGTPKLSKEQIAARNAAIQAKLLDATGDVDLVEELKGLVAPAIRAEIEAEIAKVRPVASSSLEATGEEIAERFKAKAFKGLGPLQDQAEEEFDKIVKPENYSWLASLSAADRKAQLDIVQERVQGRLYGRAIERKSARNVAGGSGGSAVTAKSGFQAKFDALPLKERRTILAFAEKSAKYAGLDPSVDKKRYDAHVRDRVNAQLEDEE